MSDYYDIAIDDLKFIQSIEVKEQNNQLAFMCQQVCEKLLKSVLVLEDPDAKSLLNSHSLKSILRKIQYYDVLTELSVDSLANLTDVYFDTRYPGDDYYKVSKEELNKYLNLTKDVLVSVNSYRELSFLPIHNIERIPKLINSQDIFDKYRLKYNITNDDEWFADLCRLSKLAKTSNLDYIAEYILNNFL